MVQERELVGEMSNMALINFYFLHEVEQCYTL